MSPDNYDNNDNDNDKDDNNDNNNEFCHKVDDNIERLEFNEG